MLGQETSRGLVPLSREMTRGDPLRAQSVYLIQIDPGPSARMWQYWRLAEGSGCDDELSEEDAVGLCAGVWEEVAAICDIHGRIEIAREEPANHALKAGSFPQSPKP
jgi:hypothetical protein